MLHHEPRGSARVALTLARWCEEVLGKPYHLSVSKLAKGGTPAEEGAPADGETGFFCSELVAHAYKTLGLLPDERPAAGYWPVDFGEASKLALQRGATLGEEQFIDFRRPGVDTLHEQHIDDDDGAPFRVY